MYSKPFVFRDLRRYSKVLEYIHDDRRRGDADALAYFQKGVEQGIFRSDINFQIINQAMAMQMDLLIYSDITDHYPLAEIYSEITILHMRGITTEKVTAWSMIFEEYSRKAYRIIFLLKIPLSLIP